MALSQAGNAGTRVMGTGGRGSLTASPVTAQLAGCHLYHRTPFLGNTGQQRFIWQNKSQGSVLSVRIKYNNKIIVAFISKVWQTEFFLTLWVLHPFFFFLNHTASGWEALRYSQNHHGNCLSTMVAHSTCARNNFFKTQKTFHPWVE